MLLFLISLSASCIGAICGMGGGVIMKPLIDALHIMAISEISFLSSCTVLSMATISLYKGRNNKRAEGQTKRTVLLILGAILGGLCGKSAFQVFQARFLSENTVGFIQSTLLLAVLLLTLAYTLQKARIAKKNIRFSPVVFGLGITLGFLSSFLGIGGGPFNLAAFEYFFGMKTKEAARASICIIFFSQISALIQVAVLQKIPPTNPLYAVYMLCGGIVGGYIGSFVNKKISDARVSKLFLFSLMFIIGICMYNMIRFY